MPVGSLRSEPTGTAWLTPGRDARTAASPGGIVHSFYAGETLRVGDEVSVGADLKPVLDAGPDGQLLGLVVGGRRTKYVCASGPEDIGQLAATVGQIVQVCVLGVAFMGSSPEGSALSVVTPGSSGAPRPWGIPVVASTSERDTLFSAPATNQRVQNLETKRIERWDGTTWVVDTLGTLGLVSAYGATGDGLTNDTAAITAAIAAVIANGGGTVTFPPGRFMTTANLEVFVSGVTACSIAIVGDPFGGSTIVPTSAVTRAIDIDVGVITAGQASRVQLAGIHIDGSSTSGATGIAIGKGSQLNAYHVLDDVEIYGFAHSGGRGLDICNCVGITARNFHSQRNTTNVWIEATQVSLPTTLHFQDCWIYLATDYGVVIKNGERITFDNCNIESNGKEAVAVIPSDGTSNVLGLTFEDCWLEANNTGGAYTDGTFGSMGLYHVYASAAHGATVSCSIRRATFVGTSKGAYYKGVINFVIDQPEVPNSVSAFMLFESDCSGHVVNWPQNNAPIATAITNNSVNVFLDAAALGLLLYDLSVPTLYPTTTQNLDYGKDSFRIRQVFATAFHRFISQPTFGASITPDARFGSCQIIANAATAPTINAPSNGVYGASIILTIRNSSGGVMGNVTFAGGFALDSTLAFVKPANGVQTTATFEYDTVKWRQVTPWVVTTV